MGKIVDFTARLILAGKKAYARKWSFLGVFALAFLASIVTLGKLDLLPGAVSATAAVSPVSAAASASKLVAAVEVPVSRKLV